MSSPPSTPAGASGTGSGTRSTTGSAGASEPNERVLGGYQRALAAEQQAAFGYALLGPSVANGLTATVRSLQALHEDLRDQVTGLVATAGAAPVAPLGDYAALYRTLATPELLAAGLEDACAAGWRYLYAAASYTAPGDAFARSLAQKQLTAAAVRATRWRVRAKASPAVTPFPGI